jgi:transcriptional regulator with XRE-family HTH domain
MRRKLIVMGENIKLARLRRKLSGEQVVERANVSINILNLIENGDETVLLGDYISVLRVLNLDNDIYGIASNDALGRKLQDIELLSNIEPWGKDNALNVPQNTSNGMV